MLFLKMKQNERKEHTIKHRISISLYVTIHSLGDDESVLWYSELLLSVFSVWA